MNAKFEGYENVMPDSRVSLASAALSRARATRRHGDTFTNRDRRRCALAADFADKGIYGHGLGHKTYSSALLDGFSVDEVTRAGG